MADKSRRQDMGLREAEGQAQRPGVNERTRDGRALAHWLLAAWGVSGQFEGSGSEGVKGLKSHRDGTHKCPS